MKEYIEREALINLIEENVETKFDWSESVDIDILRPAIKDIPAADVAPVVHGKWIGKKYNWDNDYNPPEVKDSHYLVCSNCDHRHPLYNYSVWTNTLTRCTVFTDPITIPNYCPKCGAKMKED